MKNLQFRSFIKKRKKPLLPSFNIGIQLKVITRLLKNIRFCTETFSFSLNKKVRKKVLIFTKIQLEYGKCCADGILFSVSLSFEL